MPCAHVLFHSTDQYYETHTTDNKKESIHNASQTETGRRALRDKKT